MPQFPLIRDATRAFSLPCIEEDNLEADDLIASLRQGGDAARVGRDDRLSDKDLMQLVGQCAEPHDGIEGGCIDMLDTMKNQRIDIPEVIEKFGVPPELVGDVLALMGDSVDNVPGIYGIGPKTASKLIQDYGNLHRRARRGAGDEARQAARPADRRARDGRAQPRAGPAQGRLPAADAARRLQARAGAAGAARRSSSTAHGFTSLLKRLDDGKGSPDRPTQLNPAKQDMAGAPRHARQATASRCPNGRAVDRTAYETRAVARAARALDRARLRRARGGDRHRDQRPRRDARRADRDQPGARAQRRVLRPARPRRQRHVRREAGAGRQGRRALGAASRCSKATRCSRSGRTSSTTSTSSRAQRHRRGADRRHDDRSASISTPAARDDGIGGGHGMDELSRAPPRPHHADLQGHLRQRARRQIPFGEVPLDRATEYAAEDADVTWRLYKVLKPRLAEEGGTQVYERVDRPLIPVVAQMERHGIKVDRQRARRPVARNSPRRSRGSSARSGIAAGSSSPSAAPRSSARCCSTSSATRAGARARAGSTRPTRRSSKASPTRARRSPRMVLEWRQLSKLRSTYTEALQAAINPATGPRAHLLLAGRRADRAALLDRPQPAEHPDPHRDRPAHPRGVRAPKQGNVAARGRLLADRAAPRRAHGRRAAAEGGVRRRRGHPLAHRAGDVRHGRPRHPRARQDGQLRDPLRHQPLGPRRPARDRGRRGAGDHRPLLRALPRHPALHRPHARERARARLFGDAVRAQDLVPADQRARSRTSARAASARRSTRRSRAPAPTSSSARWRGCRRRWPTPGSGT